LDRGRGLSSALIAFATLALLVSCNDASRQTYRDRGTACLAPGDETAFSDCSERVIPDDVPFRVSVDFGVCLSSSCDRELHAACRASRSGNVVTITAEATVEFEQGTCTLDCNSLSTECELEPLPAGSYEVRYGEASSSITVPSTTAMGCVGTSNEVRCCDTSGDCDGSACENNHCSL
jgi:hypothetical protein